MKVALATTSLYNLELKIDMRFPAVLLVIVLHLILKSTKATQCINTVEDLIDALNTGLKTSRHTTHNDSDSLLDMSARRIQRHSLIIIRFNTATTETNSTRNHTNTCCRPEQEGCIIVIAVRKHILHILPPLLLYALGAPLNRNRHGPAYPEFKYDVETSYCWTPPTFCSNVERSSNLKDFIASVS